MSDQPQEPGASGTDKDSVRTGASGQSDSGLASEQGLTPEELEQLSELKARDQEVRTHEAAHQATGGQYAGAMSLTYERGPDGVNYAVAGEVPIDVSPVNGDPDATIAKMRVVRAAALAPSEPSGQDRVVAAEAMKILLQAQSELVREKRDEDAAVVEEAGESSSTGPASEQSRANETYRSVSQMNGLEGALSGVGSLSVSA